MWERAITTHTLQDDGKQVTRDNLTTSHDDVVMLYANPFGRSSKPAARSIMAAVKIG